MKVGLEGMALVVTGGASGVGRAIAEGAVAAGVSQVLLSDIDGERLEAVAENLTGDAIVRVCVADLAKRDAAAKIGAAARSAFGRIDGLVNAAGATTRAGFVDGSVALWDRLFAINARSPYLLMKEAIADMLERESGGSIVNIQSVNARCGTPDLAIYSATKGALQTLTSNAANAHSADRIRVNGINLGWTLTASEHRMQADTLDQGEDWAERAAAMMPLGRLIKPDEAARLAIYLLSPASEPMTGVSMDLDQMIAGAPG